MKTETPGIDRDAMIGQLLEIQALINAANRAIWQDGSPAEDENLVTEATFILEVASEKVLAVLGKI